MPWEKPLFRLCCFTVALATVAGCMPLNTARYNPDDPLGTQSAEDAKTAHILNTLDEATRAGMAVVLIPQLLPNEQATDQTTYSPRIHWQSQEVPALTFSHDFANNMLEKDPQVVLLWNTYEVHIIKPGTYLLTGATDYGIGNNLNQVAGKDDAKGNASRKSAYGTVLFSNVLYRVFYKEKGWHDPTYTTDTHSQQVCTSVRVVSGQCASYGEQQYEQTRQTSAGGWQDDTKTKDVASLKVRTALNPKYALASFTIAPGEIVVSDRFHSKTPSWDYNPDTCHAIDNRSVECAVVNQTVFFKPAPMERLAAEIDIATALTPTQRALMLRAKAMPVKVLGKTGFEDPLWGTPISVKNVK